MQALLPSLATSLIGLPAGATTAAWNAMWARIVLHGRSGVQAYAVSALDTVSPASVGIDGASCEPDEDGSITCS